MYLVFYACLTTEMTNKLHWVPSLQSACFSNCQETDSLVVVDEQLSEYEHDWPVHL